MDMTEYFVQIMIIVGPMLALSGFISLTISLCCMLIDILINAVCGKGMKF